MTAASAHGSSALLAAVWFGDKESLEMAALWSPTSSPLALLLGALHSLRSKFVFGVRFRTLGLVEQQPPSLRDARWYA